MAGDRRYYVYSLASGRRGTLYIGVTNDIARRVAQHKDGQGGGFTRRYGVNRLIWFAIAFDIRAAIQREKTMKRWIRQWKINLVEETNPYWDDLYPTLFG